MATTYRPVNPRYIDPGIHLLDPAIRPVAKDFVDNLPVFFNGYLYNVESPPAKPPGPVKEYLTTPWSVSSAPGKIAMVREEADRVFLLYPIPWATIQLAIAIKLEATQYAQAHPTYKAIIPILITYEIETKLQPTLIEMGLITVIIPRQTVIT